MYRLEATLDTTIAEVILSAESDEEAVMDAIGVIMDNSYVDKEGVWAKGAIALIDPKGNVIHTMDAK